MRGSRHYSHRRWAAWTDSNLNPIPGTALLAVLAPLRFRLRRAGTNGQLHISWQHRHQGIRALRRGQHHERALVLQPRAFAAISTMGFRPRARRSLASAPPTRSTAQIRFFASPMRTPWKALQREPDPRPVSDATTLWSRDHVPGHDEHRMHRRAGHRPVAAMSTMPACSKPSANISCWMASTFGSTRSGPTTSACWATPLSLSHRVGQSKIPGFAVRGTVPNFHGFTAFIVLVECGGALFQPAIQPAWRRPQAGQALYSASTTTKVCNKRPTCNISRSSACLGSVSTGGTTAACRCVSGRARRRRAP